MIASFLLPYHARNCPAIFSWVFYRQLARLPRSETLFILGQAYLDELQDNPRAGEALELSGGQFRTRIPTSSELAGIRTAVIDERVFEDLDACVRHTTEGYRELLLNRYPPLERELDRILRPNAGELECILTWCNCPSLSAVARGLGVPVIHHEAGPLRHPAYRPTAYLDLGGVNGGTSAAAQWLETREAYLREVQPLPRASLHQIMLAGASAAGALQDAPATHALGVALQVEDDSNLIAFNNGWTPLDLLQRARETVPPAQLLARPHPYGHFQPRAGNLLIDDSPDAQTFIRRCGTVATINSSVALEALLAGRNAIVLGEASFAFLAHRNLSRATLAAPPPADDAALDFYLLAYLIPEDLLFDIEYLRWRLTSPPLVEIRKRHLALHTGSLTDATPGMIARLLLARFVTDLEARYKIHEAQIANLPALERSLAELESRAQAQEQELQESRRLAESASRENARLRQLLAKATVR